MEPLIRLTPAGRAAALIAGFYMVMMAMWTAPKIASYTIPAYGAWSVETALASGLVMTWMAIGAWLSALAWLGHEPDMG